MPRNKLRLGIDLFEKGLLSNGKYGYGHKDSVGPDNRRRQAIEKVLTELPDPYYSDFERVWLNDGAWFVPGHDLWGKAAEIPHKSVIIYLTPVLEFADEDVVEAVVLHEVLHVALGHKLTGCSADEDQRQELEIAEKMAVLGYVDPSDKLTELFKSMAWPPMRLR